MACCTTYGRASCHSHFYQQLVTANNSFMRNSSLSDQLLTRPISCTGRGTISISGTTHFIPSSMLTIMCEKPSPTKRTDLPEVPGPTLRSRNLRHTRPLETTRHLENHSSKSIFYSQRALTKPSSYTGHTRGKEIIPRVEGKSPIASNPNMQRKILSASFPKSVDTVPLKSKVTLVKSNLAVGRLADSQHRLGVTGNRSTHSAWTKHVHYKHVTRPLVTMPRAKDEGNERTSLKEFDDMVPKNYEPETDHSTQNGNMGYKEKCLHWLLTLPD